MKQQSVLRILAAVSVFAVLFIGVARNASAQQICGNNSSGPLGNVNQYAFGGDQWNSAFSSTHQCETIANSTAPPPSGPSMVYSGDAFDDTTSTPANYPDFLYGCFYGSCTQNTQLPIQVSALSNWSITSGETVVEPSGDNNDVAYDIWFNTGPTTPTNQNTTGTELMIWVQHNGSAGPIGCCSPAATFTSSGHTWSVYTGFNTGNCNCSGPVGAQVISFVNDDGDGPTSGTTYSLDLVPFFEEALSLGQIQSSWYLTTIEFGTEIWIGGPGIQVNDFWVNVAPAGSGGSTLTTNTPYNIINKNSGSCVDATGSGTTNGTTVQQWACGSGTFSTQANQEWVFESAGNGNYYVESVNAPSETWNVVNNGTTNSSLTQLWTYAGNPNEVWKAVSMGNGYYEFVGEGSGLCLDTPGASTANGVQLQIYTCNGTGAQLFKLTTP
jgi:Glycosyl hydrolase family 12/Ricin-type beta-trefoil lectin domain-like